LQNDHPPACGSHHRQMVDDLDSGLSHHSTAWLRWLRADKRDEQKVLQNDHPPACGSHHRQMVDPWRSIPKKNSIASQRPK